MGRRTLLLITSLLLATIGTGLVALYVRGAENRATAGQTLVKVLVADNVIGQGTSWDAAQLKFQDLPKSAVAEGALGSLDDVKGKVATTTIYRGQQILAPMFSDKSSPVNSAGVSRNNLGVSVQMSDPSRVAGFLTLGSQVTVFDTYTDPSKGQITRVLLPRATVVGIGNASTNTATQGGAGGPVSQGVATSIVTLDLPQADASRVIFASQSGQLYFGLFVGGTPPQRGASVDLATLFSN